MRIYYTAVDCGDGSLSVNFYDSQEAIDLLEEYDLEGARGEGGSYFDIEGFATGITVETLEDVKDYLVDMCFCSEEDLKD
jgi:hypothetical protein